MHKSSMESGSGALYSLRRQENQNKLNRRIRPPRIPGRSLHTRTSTTGLFSAARRRDPIRELFGGGCRTKVERVTYCVLGATHGTDALEGQSFPHGLLVPYSNLYFQVSQQVLREGTFFKTFTCTCTHKVIPSAISALARLGLELNLIDLLNII